MISMKNLDEGMDKTTILVTGGLGFIGSNFINELLEKFKTATVINLDKVTYAADSLNIKKNKRYVFKRASIINKEKINSVINEYKPELIINFAAETHVDNAINNSEKFIETNVIGTRVLLDAARRYNLRFHQVSTDEVFGQLDSQNQTGFDEKSSYNPRNPYSASKAAADFLVKVYNVTYGMRSTISYCSNNYGPNQHVEKFIPKVILKATKNEKIPIYGNGAQQRNWLFVNDHVEGLIKALSKEPNGDTYFFGGPTMTSNLTIASKILDYMQKPKSLITFVPDRPGHDFSYKLNYTKTSQLLDWVPRTNLNEGLTLTINHYLTDRKRYFEKIIKLRQMRIKW